MTHGPQPARRGPEVRDAMRCEVVTIDAGATVAVAAERMGRHDVGCLPVLERGALVGMVTDRDLVVRALAQRSDAGRVRVGEVMSTGPLTIGPGASIETAYHLMMRTGIRRLMVVEDEAKLVGLISWNDLDTSTRRPAASRRVGFYRRVCDSSGHPHRIELFRLYVSPGVPESEVEPFAIARFESANGRMPWRVVADDYDVANV